MSLFSSRTKHLQFRLRKPYSKLFHRLLTLKASQICPNSGSRIFNHCNDFSCSCTHNVRVIVLLVDILYLGSETGTN